MGTRFGRRRFLGSLAVGAAAVAFPHVWIKKAVAATNARGTVKHLVYVRLAGGFRFTAAFNGDTADQFNPFGLANAVSGTQWGPSKLLESATWLDGDANKPRRDAGMKKLTEFSNEVCLLPCVDHEPFAARADGNHGTGLERYLTGYVGGSTAFLTYVNYGLRQRQADALAQGKVLLPAFSLGDAGMSAGAGPYAAYRPPVVDGQGFDRFHFDAAAALPDWARTLAGKVDLRVRDRVHPTLKPGVDAFLQTRDATRTYGDILGSEALKVSNRSTTLVDGISNQQLETLLGTDDVGRRAALGLRLFHHGCPAVFLNQGGYDFHSGEEGGLSRELDGLTRLLSGLRTALKQMTHEDGGTYWDHTLVVCGSEFGRTTGGQRFNSAGGSDHGSDYATRWLSMPLMGGLVDEAGRGGARVGNTRREDLGPDGAVFSYRALLKTLLDVLGCDHEGVFPADAPIAELFA